MNVLPKSINRFILPLYSFLLRFMAASKSTSMVPQHAMLDVWFLAVQCCFDHNTNAIDTLAFFQVVENWTLSIGCSMCVLLLPLISLYVCVLFLSLISLCMCVFFLPLISLCMCVFFLPLISLSKYFYKLVDNFNALHLFAAFFLLFFGSLLFVIEFVKEIEHL